MSQPFSPREAWRYCLGVGALCLVLSTELLFNPGTLADWTAAQLAAGWLEQLLDTVWLGMLALLAVAATDRRFQRDSRWRLAALLAAAALASGGGYAALTLFHFPAGYYPPLPVLASEALRAMVLATMFTLAWGLQRQAARAAQRTRRLDLDRAVLHRRTEEARLKVLEAQIEPHFLFNTLATVKCLYQAGAADADRMLSSLQTYLGAALPRFRDNAASLAGECALAGAYLDILQIRMGSRLQFAIDVPTSLGQHAFPPMMLLTLVENAIKHGLGPAAAGGRIDIGARACGDMLVVSVADNGVGFQSSCGSGLGLVNIRARLRALHGEGAALALRQNTPRGVVASISVPLRQAAPNRPREANMPEAIPAPPIPAPPIPGPPAPSAPSRAPSTAPQPITPRPAPRQRAPAAPAAPTAPTAHDADAAAPADVATAAAPDAPSAARLPIHWRQVWHARWPLVLLIGLATGTMDELRVLSIDMDGNSWRTNLASAAIICFNALMGTAVLVAAITATQHAALAPRWRPFLLAAAVLASAPLAGALHLPLTYLVHQFGMINQIDDFVGLYAHATWTALATGALLAAGFSMNERSRRAATRLWAARSERTEAKRSMVESRLSILKARIEPALLVREIGRIQALYGTQRERAERQLENLIAYLQAALPHLHGGGATLGEELALAQAYLQLQAGSWGERLAWRVDVEPTLHGLRFPPMTLLPLIDDALRRGAASGQRQLRLLVRVQAAAAGFQLTLEDNCAAVPPDSHLQDAVALQAQSFRDFYGQHGRVSREMAGNATRVALTAEFDAGGMKLGV